MRGLYNRVVKKECKTCGWLKSEVTIEQSPPDWSQQLPDEVNKLSVVAGPIRQCPACHALFKHSRDKDAGHFMGSTYETMRRLSPTQALDGLLATDYDGPLLRELQSQLRA